MNSTTQLACITGASSGIGQAYARLLASQGYDLLLVARRANLLQCLADEMAQAHGTRTEILPLDLTIPGNINQLARHLTGSDNLRALINSAGYGTAAYFSGSRLADQAGMVELHVNAPVRLAHAALDPMLRANRGVIVNVSSLVAFFQVPTVAVYAATKRFIVDFSQSLGMELHRTPLRVQALCPGLTATDMHDHLAFNTHIFPRMAWMTPAEVVQASWRAAAKRSGVYIPGAFNKMVYTFTRPIPTFVIRRALLWLEPLLVRFLNQEQAA